MSRGLAPLLGAALLLPQLIPATAAAKPTIKEPETGWRFVVERRFDGARHICLGVGVREYLWIDVYAAAFYVERDRAKKSFASLLRRKGGRFRSGSSYAFNKLRRSRLLHEWLRWGRFNRVMVMVFVRDVPGNKSRKTFEKQLKINLGNIHAPDVKRDVQRFLAEAGKSVKKGTKMFVHFHRGGRMLVRIGRRPPIRINNAKLARAVMGPWFGPRPISKALQRNLVSRIAELAKP